MADLSTLRILKKRYEEPEYKAPVTVRAEKQQTRFRPHFDPQDAQSPWVTTGPVGRDSAGYSIVRATKSMLNYGLAFEWPEAKFERHIHDQLVGLGYPQEDAKGVLIPMAAREIEMEHPVLKREGLYEAMVKSATGFDPDYLSAMFKQYMVAKALGEDLDTAGGFFVRPERPAEIIDILRDRSLLGRTSIREIPLPKSGRLELNKTTADVTWVDIGENSDISAAIGANQPALGQVNLSAKTSAGFATLSNQLISDSTPSAEMWVRNLYGMSLAEYVNTKIIVGSGFNNSMRGILNTPGVTLRIASTTSGTGDTLEAEDPALAISDTAEANGEFTEWIMRPIMVAVIRNRRSDAITANDKKGLFLFVEANAPKPAMLQGYSIAESTKVPNTRSKGGANNLTCIIGGMLSQIYYGRMATMEIKSSDVAGSAFVNNQTYIRAIVRHDLQIGIPATVVVIDTLKQS